MNDPLESIFSHVSLKTNAFPAASRYHGIETAAYNKPDGETINYIRRRFIPPAERFSLLLEHTVSQGQRVDNITSDYLGDPEQFWRICDSNNVLHPDEITEITGRRIRITLPEGIPGINHA